MSKADLTAPDPTRFPVGTELIHRSGGRYMVLDTPDRVRIEATAEPAYVYAANDGSRWVRCQAEMEDGRFQLAQ